METLSYLPAPGPPPQGTVLPAPGTSIGVPPGAIGTTTIGMIPQATPPLQPPTSPEMPGINYELIIIILKFHSM
jgi:hypothetical protein